MGSLEMAENTWVKYGKLELYAWWLHFSLSLLRDIVIYGW